MIFSKAQLEAMRIVHSDLDFIAKEWTDQVDDDTLRRFSATLRQLLVDEGGLMQKVEDWIQTKCYVQASSRNMENAGSDDTAFFSTGGARFNGMTIQDITISNRVLDAKEIRDNYSNNSRPRLVKYSIEKYLSAPCITYEGETFNRTDLIKFVANKLGGTHYELEKKKLARMRSLDNAKEQIYIAGKSSIYYEFLSIGQTIVKSKYTNKLKKKIRLILENSL